MSQAYQLEIVTVYNAAPTPDARNRLRALALITLAVAAAWLWGVNQKADPWLKGKLILAGINEAGALLFGAPADKAMTEAEKAALLQQAAEGERRAAILTAIHYVWLAAAYLTGAWLALAGLTGALNRRISLRLHGQAAKLILLSTIFSIAGIWAAIRFGGMPPQADVAMYAKIGAIQSSYAWIILIAARLR